MFLRVFLKTIFPALATGVVSMLLADQAFANCESSGGSGGASVPEIGAGSAAAALSLLSGGAFMLKDRFFGTRDDVTKE